jgi:hypothetical protein
MSIVAKIQRDFRHFVQGHGHEDFAAHLKPTNVSKEAQLTIYLNNVFSVHKRSLEVDYPIIFSLLEEKDARAMVQDYAQTSFPCTGALEDWGGGLVPFIQYYEPLRKWPYLAEIAQYEWAKHIAYGASEGLLLTADDMKQFLDADQKELTFQFQNSCHLLAFLHPLEEILDRHQQGHKEPICEIKGSSYVLILKHEGLIVVRVPKSLKRGARH